MPRKCYNDVICAILSLLVVFMLSCTKYADIYIPDCPLWFNILAFSSFSMLCISIVLYLIHTFRADENNSLSIKEYFDGTLIGKLYKKHKKEEVWDDNETIYGDHPDGEERTIDVFNPKGEQIGHFEGSIRIISHGKFDDVEHILFDCSETSSFAYHFAGYISCSGSDFVIIHEYDVDEFDTIIGKRSAFMRESISRCKSKTTQSEYISLKASEPVHQYPHAEGYSTGNNYSHAEGVQSKAYGAQSGWDYLKRRNNL